MTEMIWGWPCGQTRGEHNEWVEFTSREEHRRFDLHMAMEHGSEASWWSAHFVTESLEAAEAKFREEQ